jgi:hypothetical protein
MIKQPKLRRFFILSSGGLLFVTAVAKLVSASGNARILQYLDPVLAIPFRNVFWSVGALEIAVALVCFFGKQEMLQAGLIAWLATNFVVYRLGLLWVGYHKPCPCLGNLTEALHISPHTGNTVLKIILAYLLIGSYATLLWLWKHNYKLPLTNATVANSCVH